jgi:PhoH-like ATPase
MNSRLDPLLLEESDISAAVKKAYVLDTNVLLHDPMAMHSFNEHKVVIPMTVLEELDQIKDRRDKDVSREARIAIGNIDKILADADTREIQEGVEIFSPVTSESSELGTLAVYPDQLISHENESKFLRTNIHHDNDNRIINVALKMQEADPDTRVCLVTKDINMRLKAKGSGLLHVEDYRNDKVLDDIDLLATGAQEIEGSFWDRVETVTTVQELRATLHEVPRDTLDSNSYLNQFVIDEAGFVGRITRLGEEVAALQDLNTEILMSQRVWGLTPRNLEQSLALHLLRQQELDLNILVGPAGSGKTLLALAFGLHAILEEKRYNKLIVARSTPPIAEDIGFLPGTEEEKMAPWLAAFDDNLEVLHGSDESPYGSVEYVKERANIQFKSLNFMRGRSFSNAYIIIDEAQGLTQFQLKSIITRVGQNSKIVILGNLAQIDNKYITPLTSGLTYVVERFKDYPGSGLMHINGIERSHLAAFAEENL